MSKLFNVFAAILLIVGSCFVVSDSHAKVCFLGEECGSGGNFTGTAPVNLADECIREGYTARSNCEATIGKYIAEYCPFSSNYGTCCSRENKFVSCVYPLQKSGNACGGKYKCVCDKATYKYTAEICAATNARIGGAACSEEVLTSGSNTLTTNTYYSECRCDRGLYPYYTGTDNKSGYGMRCDPNSKEEDRGQKCTEYRSDGSSEVFYASCPCNTETYPVTSLSCLPYEADDNSGRCFSGGTWYYENCTSCDGFPAKNLDNVAADGKAAVKCTDGLVPGVSCDYSQCANRVDDQNEYLIHRCNKIGYRVSVDGDEDPDNPGETLVAGQKCVPISCEEAVKIYLKNVNGYALYSSDGKLYSKTGAEIAIKGSTKYTAIIADDMKIEQCGYNKVDTTTTCNKCGSGTCWVNGQDIYKPTAKSYSTKATSCRCYNSTCKYSDSRPCGTCNASTCNCTSGSFICTSISTSDCTTNNKTTYMGLGGYNVQTYVSGYWLGNTLSDTSASVAAMKRSCRKVPTIEYTAYSFPVSSDSKSQYITFKGVDLNFSSSTTIDRIVNLENSKLTVSGSYLVFEGDVYLTGTANQPNYTGAVVNILEGSRLESRGGFISQNYEYNPSRELPGDAQGLLMLGATYSNITKKVSYTPTGDSTSKLSEISFANGQEYRVKNTIFAYDHFEYSCVKQNGSCVDVGATMTFKGPSFAPYANVYTNTYIGAWTGDDDDINEDGDFSYKKQDGSVDYHDPDYGGHDMHIKLDGAINWNLYESGKNFKIHLTPHSSISTDDISSGDFARISRGSGSYWKKCSMASTQKYAKSVYAGKNSDDYWGECNQKYWTWGRCQPNCDDLGEGCNIYGGDNSNFFVMASVDKDYKFANTYVGYLKKTVDDLECKSYPDEGEICPVPDVYVENGVVVVKDYKTANSKRKDTTIRQQLITCNGF